jgi:endoglucanase
MIKAAGVFLLAMSFVLCRCAAGPLALTGVNLAGAEFGRPPSKEVDTHSKFGVDYSYPTAAEAAYFSSQGMNIFRYPFLWERLQRGLQAPLDAVELDRLKTSVKFATTRNLVVLIDPHNYARYQGEVIGGAKVSGADFADFWRRLSLEFKEEPCVWFGLMNEPRQMPTGQWIAAANQAIAAIRATGAKNLILVPGNFWTGAHSWLAGGEESNAKHLLKVVDPLDYWAVEVHQYVDADSSGTKPEITSPMIGAERLMPFANWCRQHKKRALLGEFGVPAIAEGRQTLDHMLQSMAAADDVWLGWTWWAAGSRWGDYLFTIEPKDGVDRPQMTWLRPHLHGSSLPQFTRTVKNGTGGGGFAAGSVQAIEANPAPDGMVFDKWTGDTAWLADPAARKTGVTMPFKDITVEAEYKPIR